MNSRISLVLFTIILVAITTACKYFFGPVPALSGVTPVFAIALFSGLVIRKKEWLFIFPLVSLFVSDVAIQILYQQGVFDYPGIYAGQWKNYLLLLSCTLLGWGLRGKNYATLVSGAVASPTVFFLLSNFMVWLQSSEQFYAKSFEGLMTCYVAGLPFYRNSLLATIVFLPVVLFLYNYLGSRKAALTVA